MASLLQSGQKLCGASHDSEIRWDQTENQLELEAHVNFYAFLPPSLPYQFLLRTALSKPLLHASLSLALLLRNPI